MNAAVVFRQDGFKRPKAFQVPERDVDWQEDMTQQCASGGMWLYKDVAGRLLTLAAAAAAVAR